MRYCTLGKTGLRVSKLAFGAGPISTLMIGEDGDRQHAVIEQAIRRGVNWFDTAATYGSGQSERNLGRVLTELGAAAQVHVATKARLLGQDLADIAGAVRQSLEASLTRLRVSQVTLLQLHNSITAERGDEPTSITPRDVLGTGGVLETFQKLRAEGLVRHLGLTGIGQADALREVVGSGEFDTMQVPYHVLNPSAGRDVAADFPETNFGNVIAACAGEQMGVLAIRVLAGGALAGNAPSPHTLKTPFFPLALYERDRVRAARLQEQLGPQRRLPAESIRFALAHPQVHAAIIGFGEIWQLDETLQSLELDAAPVDWDELRAWESRTDGIAGACRSST